jgi:hypothetical protein
LLIWVKKFLLLLLGLCYLGVVTQSCGTFGNEEDGDAGDSDDDSTTTPDTGTSTNYVTGLFQLDEDETPAAGYQIWILNHSERSFVSIDLDEFGAFSRSVRDFQNSSIYTIHLVNKDYVEIGMLDMSAAAEGVQGAITYNGGLGFNMGTVIVNIDSKGVVDEDSTGLDVKVGGGFSVSTSSTIDFKSFPFPEYATKIDLESELTVFEPSKLLNSFYLRDTNTESYSLALAENSRIYGFVASTAEDGISSASVFRSGDWLSSARIAPNTYSNPDEGALWSVSSYNFTAPNSSTFEANIYSGRVVKKNTILLVSISPNSESQPFIGPTVLRYSFSMTPKLDAISVTGGTPSEIDYTSSSAENGLTRPFCVTTSDLVFDLDPPEDADGTAVTHTVLDTIQIDYVYYYLKSSKLTAVSPDASDYGGDFGEDYSDTSLADITRNWDVSEQSATFTLGTTAGASSPRQVTAWGDLLLDTADGKTVDKIELRIYFKHSADLQRSGIVVWLDPDC